MIYYKLLLVEEFFWSFDTWFDSIFAWLPASWADFAVFVNKLKGFDQSKNFVDTSADWEIVDCDLSNVMFFVDDEQTSVGDSGFWNHYSVGFADIVVGVGE